VPGPEQFILNELQLGFIQIKQPHSGLEGKIAVLAELQSEARKYLVASAAALP